MRVVFLLPLMALAGCEANYSRTADGEASELISEGDVALYAQAPDGTKLWAVKGRSGRTVYFSSSGTQTHHSRVCGKNCNRKIDDVVPNAPLPPMAAGQ